MGLLAHVFGDEEWLTVDQFEQFKNVTFSYSSSDWVIVRLVIMGFPDGSAVKHLYETRVWSLGWEDPLEEEMATCSSIIAWRIPWTEEPGGLQPIESQSWRWLKWFRMARKVQFKGLCSYNQIKLEISHTKMWYFCKHEK